MTEDRKATVDAFKEAVNMTPAALGRWLDSDDSKAVGMLPGGERRTAEGKGESVGHHMGERILEIKARAAAALTEDDLADMRKVTGYVHRHLAQRPKGDTANGRWRKSLMNWGHDPEG